MRWILCSLLGILNSQAFANNFVKGEGHFYQHNGDSYQFIKEQLIYESVKSIVSKEIEQLGLNKEKFWEKYESKLNKKFENFEESLKASLNITENSSPAQRQNYKDELRKRKLNYRKRFLGFNRLLTKYAISKISRSSRDPKYRIMKLEGQLDRNYLTKIYYNLVSGKRSTAFNNLYIKTHFKMNNLSFTELGIENEKDFEGEISKSWLTWLSQHKPVNVSTVQLLDDEKSDRLIEYLKIPADQVLTNVPEVFESSLLFDIEMEIIKREFDENLNSYKFEYKGHAYLKDLHSNLIVGSYDFGTQEKKYRLSGNLSLANLIANHVYQMAVGYFNQVQSSVKAVEPITQVMRLHAFSFKNINQINSFIELIEQKGIKHSLKAKVDSFGLDNIDLLLYYDGQPAEIKELLSASQSAKKGIEFDLIETDKDFGIKFKEVTETL